MPQKLPRVVGITGGIGSGKTLVCSVFEELGAPVYNSDKAAKRIIHQNPLVKKAICTLLGENAYTNEGEYNVPYVKEKVFNNTDLLTELNNIVHPAVADDFKEWLQSQTFPYVIKESALLLKESIDAFFNVIYCSTKASERIQRIKQRDPNRSFKEIEAIINQQDFNLPQNDKLLVLNNNEEDSILMQILNWHKGFIN